MLNTVSHDFEICLQQVERCQTLLNESKGWLFSVHWTSCCLLNDINTESFFFFFCNSKHSRVIVIPWKSFSFLSNFRVQISVKCCDFFVSLSRFHNYSNNTRARNWLRSPFLCSRKMGSFLLNRSRMNIEQVATSLNICCSKMWNAVEPYIIGLREFIQTDRWPLVYTFARPQCYGSV